MHRQSTWSLASSACLLAAALLSPLAPLAPAAAQPMAPADSGETPLVPMGNGFTYQGFLTQSGGPASGPWDFQFALFDAAAAGVQIGGTATVNDLSVSAGVFTATMNFGPAAFGGGARWLEIRVRPGASIGPYSTLNPRQSIFPAPSALSMPNVYTDEALNFVGVGRSFRISGNEVFGVRAPTGAETFGGMYVETLDVNGWPFYGFATGGSFRAWTSYKHTNCAVPPCTLDEVAGWKLSVSGVKLAVPTTGGLRIGPSADYSLTIENSTGSDGVRIFDTADDAIQIGSDPDYANYGVYIPSPGVSTYGLWPNTAQAAGEWALFTVDNIQSGNVFSAGLTQIARVGSGRALEVGDLVAATGFAAGIPGAQDLLPRVGIAANPEHLGVIGVVRSRMELVPKAGKEGADAFALESVPGKAQPGDFVALTVRGVTLVRIDSDEVVEVGQRLTVAESEGTARPLRSRTLEGMEVTEGTPVIGIVVGEVDEDSGLVAVYVMLP